MSTYKERIAQNILTRLDSMNVNYSEFCKQCGIGHSEISKMKMNPERITIPFLLSVANGMGCSYADLYRNAKMNLPHMTVGRTYLQRIRNRRKQMGLSAKQVAVLLDVRLNSYEHFETMGYSARITPEKFEKLLTLLELNHTELRGKVTNDHAKQQQLFAEETKPEDPVKPLMIFNVGATINIEVPVAAYDQKDAIKRMDRVMDELEQFMKDKRCIDIRRWWWEYAKEKEAK